MTGELIPTGVTFDVGRKSLNNAFSGTAYFNHIQLDSGANFSGGTGGGKILSGGTDLYNIFGSGGGESTTASNGLTLSGIDVQLGGSLSNNTNIFLNSNELLLSGGSSGTFVLSGSNASFEAFNIMSYFGGYRTHLIIGRGAATLAGRDTSETTLAQFTSVGGASASVNMSFSNGSGVKAITADANNFYVRDSIFSAGLVYFDDYSASFSARSIIDLAYMTGYVASAEIKVQPGTNITTGGTPQFPIINLDNNVILGSVSATTVSASTMYSGGTPLRDIFEISDAKWSAGTGENAVVQVQADDQSVAGGTSAVAFGRLNDASGNFSLAGGLGVNASGSTSFAYGVNNTAANGDYSFAFGFFAEANGDYSFAAGKGNVIAIIAGGRTSFNFSEVTNNYTGGGAQGDYSAILGGLDNEIEAGTAGSFMAGGQENIISNGIHAAIIAGTGHTIETGTISDGDWSAIIGGKDHYVRGQNIVILGGEGITATTDNTAYAQRAYLDEYIDLNPQTTLPSPVTGRMFFSGGSLNRLMVNTGGTAADWIIVQ